MKIILNTLLSLVCLACVSCQTNIPKLTDPILSKTNYTLFNDVGAADNSGNTYSGDQLDRLRGMSNGRNVESNKWSQDFLKLPKHEYKETSPAIPYTVYPNGHAITAYSPACTTTYTGKLKAYQWKWHGKWQLFVVREVKGQNGYNFWQGTNPPQGYYTVKEMYQTILN